MTKKMLQRSNIFLTSAQASELLTISVGTLKNTFSRRRSKRSKPLVGIIDFLRKIY